METLQAHLTNLIVDPFNPRKSVDSEAITNLANSIRAMGVVSPLVCRPTLPAGVEPLNPDNTRYQVLCGSRRMAAARLAGLTSVPVTVRELTDAEAAAVALSEQDSVETLHFLERADAFLKWRDAGATVDEIGERMGMKRATVYAVIAMAEKLTPEARAACFEKRLNETVARKLATVPRSAQDAALKACLQPSATGAGAMTTRECEVVLDAFRRDLSKAPFDMADESLTCCEHESGSCVDCPLRSGSQPELFADVKSENLCTSPDGYQSKADANWKRLVDDGEHNRSPRCIDEKQSAGYFIGGALREDVPYVAMDAVAYEDLGQRNYRQLVPKAATRYLVRHPVTLAVIEVLDKKDVPKLLEEAGKVKRPEPAKAAEPDDSKPKLSAEEKREQAKRAERRAKVVKAVVAAMVAKVESREPDKKFWRDLADTLVHLGGLEHIWLRRGVTESPEAYLNRLDGPKLRGFCWEALKEHSFYEAGEELTGRYPKAVLEAAKAAGVDVKEHEREVIAEEKAQPTKKEKKEKAA